MSEKEPPPPPRGRVFALFRPAGSKKYSAHIVLPGGKHSEVFETGATEVKNAIGVTNGQVRKLYKVHGIESPAQWKKRTGSRLAMSTIRSALASGHVPDESKVNNPGYRGREAKLHVMNDGDNSSDGYQAVGEETGEESKEWAPTMARVENKLAMGYQRILGLFLLGLDAKPTEFREHVRAIVTEVTLSGLTPTGRFTKKRGRPAGS